MGLGVLSSNGGGSDELIMRTAVFCTVVVLISTVIFSVMLPSGAGYDFDSVYADRVELSRYTGEGITNNTPWQLVHVYTPYMLGDGYEAHIDEDGWLYGEEIEDYADLGKVVVKLDPTHKSDTPLFNDQSTVTYTADRYKWYLDGEGLLGGLDKKLRGLYEWAGWTTTERQTVTEDLPTWQYSGYRYVFDPELAFQSESEENGVSKVDGSLSIVWYNVGGQEGISGGLYIYGTNDVLLASYSAADIIAGYDSMTTFSNKYKLNFDGTPVYINIRFDPEVLTGNISLESAWTTGLWSIAITTASIGNFLDIQNSNSFANSLGNILETFWAIFTFDVPQINNVYYMAIMWLLVGLPAEIVIICFTSRFGIAGIGGGLVAAGLASALAVIG